MTACLIEAEKLHALNEAGRVFVIDTRDPDAFREGHIPNAVNIRDIFSYLSTRDSGGYAGLVRHFAKVLGAAGLKPADRVVIYEDAMDNGYGQSCRGWFILNYLGHPRVSVLHGGYLAWRALKLPVTHEAPIVERTHYEPSINPGVIASAEEMLAAIHDPTVYLVDVRDYAEWLGANSSPYGYDFCPRKGRIPHAHWFEWYRVMERRKGVPWFKSNDQILEDAARAGITAEKNIYVYCFKGARSSNVMLALQMAGILNIRNYFGSWNEWSRDFSLPIEEGYPTAEA